MKVVLVFFAISLLRAKRTVDSCVLRSGFSGWLFASVSLVIRSALFNWNVATFRFSSAVTLTTARAVNLWVSRQEFDVDLVVVGAQARLFRGSRRLARGRTQQDHDCEDQRPARRASVAELQVESPGENDHWYDVDFPAKDAVTTRVAESCKFTQMERLYLHNNQLTTIPLEVCKLAKLQDFVFCGNPLIFTLNKDLSEIGWGDKIQF